MSHPMSSYMNKSLPTVVIGAGPVGLAAASHLIARGLEPLVLEADDAVASNIRSWSHVGMFTPWRYCVDRAAAGLLASYGWVHPPADDVPTGGDLVRQYLEPLAVILKDRIRLNARVTAVTRKGMDKVRTSGRDDVPFVVRVTSKDGAMQLIEAAAVIDASGTWTAPNPAGADGLPALGEREGAPLISYGIPDILSGARDRYVVKTIAVIGSGHSALNALIELAALRRDVEAPRILWLVRKAHVEDAFGGESADALKERGALGSETRALIAGGAVEVVPSFRLTRITRTPDGLTLSGDQAGKDMHRDVQELIVATGFRPDFSMLHELRLTLDPWLESAGTIGPLIDPNLHSCGTVRAHGAKELAHAENGFFITGIKSYGRAPTFLLATGHEQVRSIAAHLAGDVDAAARVELELPETGVCNTRPPARDAVQLAPVTASACCTVETPQGVCCVPKPDLAPDAPCCGSTAPAASDLARMAYAAPAASAPKPRENTCCAVSERAPHKCHDLSQS
jgi:thioredoxin reductase